jgi:hypothetical protein
MWSNSKTFNFSDCGEQALIHWLWVQNQTLGDLKHIQNRVLFHYEHFALGDSQGRMTIAENIYIIIIILLIIIVSAIVAFFERLLSVLNMAPSVKVPVTLTKAMSRMRRELRGDASQPVLDKSLVYEWIAEYKEQVRKMPAVCMRVAERYEDQVAMYGYSLKNLRKVVATPHLAQYMHALVEGVQDNTEGVQSFTEAAGKM